MEFNFDDNDQAQILQACKAFMEEQRAQMYQHFQEINATKDTIIEDLNNKLSDAYEMLKNKHLLLNNFQLRHDEMENDISDITSKYEGLVKEHETESHKLKTTSKNLAQKEEEENKHVNYKIVSDQLMQSLKEKNKKIEMEAVKLKEDNQSNFEEEKAKLKNETNKEIKLLSIKIEDM